MKKRIVGAIIVLVVIASAIWLNRSYAHIYQRIDAANLRSSIKGDSYLFGNSEKSLTYVAIGDSLTAGVGVDSYEESYPYRVAQKLSTKSSVTLYPFAVPGAKSGDMSEGTLEKIIDLQPDIITILLGINDAHGNVSKREFRQRYDAILEGIVSGTDAKVYVIGIPYLGSSDLIAPPYDWYFDQQIRGLNAELRQLADAYDAEYIDLYAGTLTMSQKDGYYASDHFHPAAVGYGEWAAILYEHINR